MRRRLINGPTNPEDSRLGGNVIYMIVFGGSDPARIYTYGYTWRSTS
jgi:hypothetical protein